MTYNLGFNMVEYYRYNMENNKPIRKVTPKFYLPTLKSQLPYKTLFKKSCIYGKSWNGSKADTQREKPDFSVVGPFRKEKGKHVWRDVGVAKAP